MLVVFDELPTASLLSESGSIDRLRMPNFAGLGRTSTWFSSATTVADETYRAVPAILSGRRPALADRPSARDWPSNLFTLLREQYRVRSLEPATNLCPPETCGGSAPGPLAATRSLLGDSGLILSKALAPQDLADDLPPIVGEQGTHGDPSAAVERFLARLDSTRQPALTVMHVMLPHQPWRFLATGRRYSTPGDGAIPKGFKPPFWTPDEKVVTGHWKRHLIQTAYTDVVLGKILRRLRQDGTFDRSLVIVTADHGISFEPGREMRRATSANLGAAAAVPLFIKRPRQRRGVRVTGPAETVDILPTILDVIGASRDGLERRSLLAPDRPRRPVAVMSSDWSVVRAPIETVLEQRRAVLRKQAPVVEQATQPPGVTSACLRRVARCWRRSTGMGSRTTLG